MATLYIGVNFKSKDIKKVKLNNIDLNKSVLTFKKDIQNDIEENLDTCDVIYSGNILKEEDTLLNAGVSSGSILHCLPKCVPPKPIVLERFELLKVQQLLVGIRTTINNSGFRTFVLKLRTPEMVDKIYKACPYLFDDPTALSFVQDAELFQTLATPSELNKVLEDRPVLGHLVQYITTIAPNESSSRSHHVSYSLDALSDDDEEMDTEQSGDSTSASRASGSIPYQPITPGQLAAALANATANTSGAGPSRSPRSIPTTPSSATTPFNTPGGPPSASDVNSSPGVITTEMFSNALQNALAASARSAPGTASMPAPTGPGMENVEESLQLMREMGIFDEQMCIQALQSTNGDVEAAVNLVIAQLLADD